MTWSRALLCWLVAGILLVVVRATEPPPPPPVLDDPSTAPADANAAAAAAPASGAATDASPQASATPQRGYELDAARLTRVEVRRGDKTVILAQSDGRWQVVQPTDRVIPPGLVQAFVEQLVDSGHGEHIADEAKDPAFGFATPSARIDIDSRDAPRLTLVIGARTPAGTAAYALEEQSGHVVSVGLNLVYYVDLLMG
jgi:hypothetical protein